MAEGLTQAFGQGHFAGMAKRGMAQIMAHGNGFRQIFIEAQGPGDGGCNPGDLQSMGHAGAVMIALRLQKHLGFVHQAAEGFAVDNPVNIPLITGAHIPLPVFLKPGTACGSVRKGCQRI